ncbi:biotin--[acetyl-CoA-carboxylase] ligase, partial [Enterococcus lactis]|uniref:biotin--[acetyl-CoA-carboxylase] ligase n=1 Tax=Enterococcus lactis TaxID=357441 RepID=UPI003907FF72
RLFLDKFSQSNILIKWPNDIYFQDRKAGGILIENIINGQLWKWAVVGVGLNINQVQFLGDIESKAVSLKQITGKTFDCFQLAQELR